MRSSAKVVEAPGLPPSRAGARSRRSPRDVVLERQLHVVALGALERREVRVRERLAQRGRRLAALKSANESREPKFVIAARELVRAAPSLRPQFSRDPLCAPCARAGVHTLHGIIMIM